MAPVTYKVKLTRPQVFLWRMSLFLILAVLLAIILVAFVWEVAHGDDGEPWSQLAALSGGSFIVASVVLSRVS